MSRKHNEDKIRGRFTPMMHETAKSPAFKQLSFGARALFVALKMRCVKNNGRVYLSLRDAGEELDHKNRNNLANWYRELEHYGFILKTEAASLGVNGRGKAAHWRITDMPSRSGGGEFKDPTKDFLEERTVPEKPPRRSHIVAGPTRAEADAKIAELLANGTAGPDDFFVRLLALEPDPDSHMFENYRWEGRWVPKDGREDAAIARLRASGS
jgi:hypothetical protein